MITDVAFSCMGSINFVDEDGNYMIFKILYRSPCV
jgi:hypothetical protein